MVAWLVHERRLVNQYSKYNDGMYSEIISIASSGLAITIHFIGFLLSSLQLQFISLDFYFHLWV